MCHRFSLQVVLGSVLACLLLGPATTIAETDGLKADLALLADKGVANDGPGLLAFFKKRTTSEAIRKKIAGLIGMLGDEDYPTREKATTDLIEVGAPARPMLAAALRANDLEVRRRARRALDAIGSAAEETALLPAAARILADRKPAGAVEVLLEFLPNIEDSDTAEEVARVVCQVALDKDGKPERAVLLALSDRQWIKRYAAAEALARVAGQRAAVRKLLDDPDSGVRRRVALALLNAHDKEAVPALIALLKSDSREDVGAAEEMLMLVAGEKSPSQPEDDSPSSRESYRKKWERWWKDAEGKIDLAKVDFTSVGRGYTLVGIVDMRVAGGRVPFIGRLQELDQSGKVRWTIGDLSYPVYACKTRRDRVLVCEYRGSRVTERDLKGKVLWEKRVAQPLSAQRLANGNTFITARGQLLEFDKAGKEVKSISIAALGSTIAGAHRHPDGKITVVTATGQCIQLDRDGRQVRSFSVSSAGPVRIFLTTIGLKCDFRPDGGVIVPDSRANEIREYDGAGKVIWQKSVAGTLPTSVTRLANGHTLVGSINGNRIVELDKDGKEVASKAIDGRLMFLDRR
jgi:hypothetical protein